jgi:uncharacterized GH25 family protein
MIPSLALRTLLVAASVAAGALPAMAHGFWLNATHYVIDRTAGDHGAVASETQLFVGMGHIWPVEEPLSLEDLARYGVVGPDGTTALTPNAPGLLEVEVAPKVDGPHVAVASYKRHFLTGYRVDGETLWAEEPKTGKSDIVFSAYYEPYAKALLQVGIPEAEHFTEPVGDALELVPLVNPYTVQPGADATLALRVLYRGAPLAGASVFGRHSGTLPRTAFPVEARSDDDGVVRVPVTQAGIWLLKVEHTVKPRASFADQCDEETYEASITFELR